MLPSTQHHAWPNCMHGQVWAATSGQQFWPACIGQQIWPVVFSASKCWPAHFWPANFAQQIWPALFWPAKFGQHFWPAIFLGQQIVASSFWPATFGQHFWPAISSQFCWSAFLMAYLARQSCICTDVGLACHANFCKDLLHNALHGALSTPVDLSCMHCSCWITCARPTWCA